MILFDENSKTLSLSKKIYVYWTSPCDFWGGMLIADELEQEVILKLMPEYPRDNIVFKTFLPGNGANLEVFYFCKADNNGTTYIFSNCKISLEGHIEWTLDKVIENVNFEEEENETV